MLDTFQFWQWMASLFAFTDAFSDCASPERALQRNGQRKVPYFLQQISAD